MKTCPSFSNYCLTFCGSFLNVSSNIDCIIFNKSRSVYGSKISWFFCSISSPLFLMSSLKSSTEFAIPTILMLFLFKLWTNAPNFLVSPSVIVKESISSITSKIFFSFDFISYKMDASRSVCRVSKFDLLLPLLFWDMSFWRSQSSFL